jgi:uncharacterized protein YjcR
MKDNLIKLVQKFINTPFSYLELLIFLDKQKYFLLQKNILEKTEDCEYNSLWDTMLCLEDFFSFANSNNLIIISEISVLSIFNSNYKWRSVIQNKTLKISPQTPDIPQTIKYVSIWSTTDI